MAEVVQGYVEVLASDVEEEEIIAYRLGHRGEAYEKCKVCGIKYPRGEMVRFEGDWYCRELGDYQDINGIIRLRNENKDVKRDGRESDRIDY